MAEGTNSGEAAVVMFVGITDHNMYLAKGWTLGDARMANRSLNHKWVASFSE